MSAHALKRTFRQDSAFPIPPHSTDAVAGITQNRKPVLPRRDNSDQCRRVGKSEPCNRALIRRSNEPSHSGHSEETPLLHGRFDLSNTEIVDHRCQLLHPIARRQKLEPNEHCRNSPKDERIHRDPLTCPNGGYLRAMRVPSVAGSSTRPRVANRSHLWLLPYTDSYGIECPNN